ncbi:TRAP transporter large permease [Castellaniella sp.]|uniref:TRAP transporter large permease n=1 Tax=Castellaniella sp. TaxID=1955812 RepID=UPI003C71AD36
MPIITTIILLFGLLGAGAWIGLSLMGVAIGNLYLFRSMPVDNLLAQSIWNTLTSPELVALPLFILMAELLYRSTFTRNLFSSLEPWVRNLPGGLLHTNVLGCTLFALVSGSSAATTSAIGRITLPELEKRGYNRSVALGSLGGAGTLGFLIPPSIILIIYGVLTQTSILKLFAAGIVPGLVLAACFMGFLAVRSLFLPKIEAPVTTRAELWRIRIQGLPALLPFFVLMAVLLGSMYAGWASPSEAASVAVAATCVIMAFERSLSWATVKDACMGCARTVSMLGLIIGAAGFLSVSMGFLGLPQAIAAKIHAMQLSPIQLVIFLLLVYIVLGMFLEGMSMLVMTLPIVVPLILAAGYDKVWFGIFLVIVIELAQITPPVGMNLFVIQGLTNEKMSRIAVATLPFFFIMVIFVLVMAVFPALIAWLPTLIA